MSCRECVFRGVYQDMGASCDVCGLQSDLVNAVRACENSANCRHRFTVADAKEIVIEREGGLPVIVREKTEQSEKPDPLKTLNEAFASVAKATTEAIKAITEALNKESEDTV